MRTTRGNIVSSCFIALACAGAMLGLGCFVREAHAREVKCYLMVCTGSVCIANQIPCPAPPEETPQLPPGGNT